MKIPIHIILWIGFQHSGKYDNKQDSYYFPQKTEFPTL